MRLVLFVLRALILLGLTGLALLTVAAFLGFAFPLLDVLNHFQPIWLTGLLVLVVLGLLFFPRQPGRGFAMSIGFTGILASAVIVIPELVSGLVALPAPDPGVATYKLMSRNLFGMNYNMRSVTAAIADEDPDIIALQEYFSEQRNGLHTRISDDYPYFAACSGGRRAAIAIYARIPFEMTDASFCPDNIAMNENRVAWLAAEFDPEDGEPFTVVTTHLNWPIQISPLRDRTLSWTDRIAAMSARKASEYAELHRVMDDVNGPVLLVGDLNATPWSYELRQFANEVGMQRQTHNLFSYPARFYLDRWRRTPPFLPLDHLLTRGAVMVHEVGTADPAGSDHKAIVARFSIAGNR